MDGRLAADLFSFRISVLAFLSPADFAAALEWKLSAGTPVAFGRGVRAQKIQMGIDLAKI